MNFMLGNLNIQEIENKAGVVFSDSLKDILTGTHQHEAENIADGKWHCFDIPFTMVCGGMPLAQKIYDELQAQSGDFKEPMQIALSE